MEYFAHKSQYKKKPSEASRALTSGSRQRLRMTGSAKNVLNVT